MSDITFEAPAHTLSEPLVQSRTRRASSYAKHLWQALGCSPLRLSRVALEIAALRLFHGVSPSYYLLGHLYDDRFTWNEKKQFLSERRFERLVWRLNDPDYRKISQNKLAEKALLTSLGLPTPQFLGFYHPETGRVPAGRPLQSTADLRTFFLGLLQNTDEADICFKALEGWNGDGFLPMHLSVVNGDLYLAKRGANGLQPLSIENLIQQLGSSDGYVVEHFIDQHPAYAAFHTNSINSYRFWVRLGEDGTPDVPLAFLRVGTGGAVIDNGHTDRIIVPVNAKTGARKTALEPTFERPAVPLHPDSQLPTAGPALPLFDEAKALAVEALRAFPGLNFAGVDIAVSSNGPMVLELNPFPGWHGPHWCDQPTASLFPSHLLGGR